MKIQYAIILFSFCCNTFTICKAQNPNTSTYHNYYIIDRINSTNELAKGNTLDIIFYPDSIPPAKWMIPKYDTMTVQRWSGATNDSTIPANGRVPYISNQWAQIVDIKKLRVLSIINSTKAIQKYYFTFNDNFGDKSIAIIQQAQDEKGNWRDLEKFNKNDYGIRVFSDYLNTHELLNSVVEITDGDFETNIRFKMLINAPPDYPEEKYIYSKPYKGRINKSLLKY